MSEQVMDHDYCAEGSSSLKQGYCLMQGNKVAQQFVQNIFKYFVENHPELPPTKVSSCSSNYGFSHNMTYFPVQRF